MGCMKWMWCSVLGLSLLASAQQRVPVPTMGTVTGQVMCGDTQRPARFANVALINQSRISGSNIYKARGPDDVGTIWLGTTTGVDGHFEIDALTPGDYYVIAWAKGYVLPIGRLVSAKPPTDEEVAKLVDGLMRDVPIVHISAAGTEHTAVTMQRGGVVVGRVTYDDGSPVAGANVQVEIAEGMDRVYKMPFYLFAALRPYE